MTESNAFEPDVTLKRIGEQVKTGDLRMTQHAQQEITEEDVSLDDVLEALNSSEILENYPNHPRGACCLLFGMTSMNRPLHLVCTTDRPVLIIITVYEPKPPRWITPTLRGQRS